MERQMDGQTLFYRTLPATVRVPNKKNKKNPAQCGDTFIQKQCVKIDF